VERGGGGGGEGGVGGGGEREGGMDEGRERNKSVYTALLVSLSPAKYTTSLVLPPNT